MTVTYKGEIERNGKNAQGTRTYTRKFRFTTSEGSENQFTVGSQIQVPVLGATMPNDPAAMCISLSVENTEPKYGWTVTAEYTTDRDTISRTAQGEEVTSNAPKITWTSETYQRPVFKDKDGNAILNGAGDYFVDPAPTKEVSILIATIEQNVLAVPAYALSYPNSVNSSAITIDGLAIGAGLAKVQRITVGPQLLSGTIVYRSVRIEIHCNRDGWALEPLHAGFNQKYGGRIVPILAKDLDSTLQSADRTPISQPVPITSSGAVILNPTPETVEYASFDIYEQLPFSNLPGVS